MVLRLHGKENLPGHKGCRSVKLFDEFREDGALRLAADMHHIVVFAAHELSVPDKKDLYDAVCIRVFVLDGNTEDVAVFAHSLGHLLLLGDLLHALEQITPVDGLLKVHLFRGLFHFFRQIAEDGFVVAGEKFQGHVDPLPVFLCGDLPCAWSAAAVHMEIQAGAVLAEVPGQDAIAVPQAVHAVDQLDRAAHCLGTGKGSEIAGLVFFHLAGEQDAGIGLANRDLDVRIGLIILEQSVVLGTMLLDQVVLQDQRFEFGIRHDILKIADLFDHAVDLGTAAHDFAKIRADAIVEVHRLANINNRILLIVHDINTGLRRQFLQIFGKIFHSSPKISSAETCE